MCTSVQVSWSLEASDLPGAVVASHCEPLDMGAVDQTQISTPSHLASPWIFLLCWHEAIMHIFSLLLITPQIFVFVTLFIVVAKNTRQKPSKKEGCLLARDLSIMADMVCWQEPQAAGHILSIENTAAHPGFSFLFHMSPEAMEC